MCLWSRVPSSSSSSSAALVLLILVRRLIMLQRALWQGLTELQLLVGRSVVAPLCFIFPFRSMIYTFSTSSLSSVLRALFIYIYIRYVCTTRTRTILLACALFHLFCCCYFFLSPLFFVLDGARTNFIATLNYARNLSCNFCLGCRHTAHQFDPGLMPFLRSSLISFFLFALDIPFVFLYFLFYFLVRCRTRNAAGWEHNSCQEKYGFDFVLNAVGIYNIIGICTKKEVNE